MKLLAIVGTLGISLVCNATEEDRLFYDISSKAGIIHTFTPPTILINKSIKPGTSNFYNAIAPNAHLVNTGGLAVGDINNDFYPDIFLAGGILPPKLLLNNKDGSFEDISSRLPSLQGNYNNSSIFTEINGDGYDDLIISGNAIRVGGKEKVRPSVVHVLLNNRDSGFSRLPEAAGLRSPFGYASFAAGDYDGDGDLDLAAGRWHTGKVKGPELPHIWENADGQFLPVDEKSGIKGTYFDQEFSFTPTFTDINTDGKPDLLMVGDFEQTQIFLQKGHAAFSNATNPFVIDDENGMGSAVGDYDNDGDLDWFVSSIFDLQKSTKEISRGHWGASGNRLYNNDGKGNFTNVTSQAGVADGNWGWGSCFADFDNDGYLDIFHATGFGNPKTTEWQHLTPGFLAQPPRLFMNQKDGTFVEKAKEYGLGRPSEGRGISCLDYDRDGDIDILSLNFNQPAQLFQNQARQQQKPNNFIGFTLVGSSKNPRAAGAVIRVITENSEQMREVRVGSNYLSQDPAEAHFGIAASDTLKKVLIYWPGSSQPHELKTPALNQWHTLAQPLPFHSEQANK